jgi:Fe-S-cluster containining protein
MRPGKPNVEGEALAEVRAIYAELGRRPADRSCVRSTGCCQFRVTGRTPQLTRGEALLVARAVRAAGRKMLPTRDDGACPLLRGDGGCLVYQDRPLGCRTHFCAEAGGMMARSEVVDLIRKLEAVDAQLGGNGPRPLEPFVADELRQLAK